MLLAPEDNAWEVINEDPRFSIFAKLVKRVGLESVLQSKNVTVFVPANDEFQSLPDGQLERLLDNDSLLEDTVRFHIATGAYVSDTQEGRGSVMERTTFLG